MYPEADCILCGAEIGEPCADWCPTQSNTEYDQEDD